MEKGWLRASETGEDGSPLVFEAPNWSKYNIRREVQGIAQSSMTGTDNGPLLTDPSPILSNPTRKKEIAVSAVPSPAPPPHRRIQLADHDFIAQLKHNVAFRHINIEVELGKMDAWFLTPKGRRRKKTMEFVVNWLSRAADSQREVSLATAPCTSSSMCSERVLASNGRTYVPCGKPIAVDQESPPRPFCSDHLLYRIQIDTELKNGGTA